MGWGVGDSKAVHVPYRESKLTRSHTRHRIQSNPFLLLFLCPYFLFLIGHVFLIFGWLLVIVSHVGHLFLISDWLSSPRQHSPAVVGWQQPDGSSRLRVYGTRMPARDDDHASVVLSCLVLSCLVLSYLVLACVGNDVSCLVLSSLI